MLRINYITEVKDLEEASKKYVLEHEGKIYQADNEQDIMSILIDGYTEVDDPNMQLLYRIDLARAIEMISLAVDLNIEIVNGEEAILENYAAAEGDPDYEKDYENPDFILDVKNENTIFSGINKLGYARVYTKAQSGYELIN